MGSDRRLVTDIDRLTRYADVIEKMRGGMTVDEIAAAYNVRPATIRNWKLKAYEAAQRELDLSVEGYRLAQVQRREELIDAYWEKAVGGDLDAARFVKDMFKELEQLLGLNVPTEKEAGAQTVYVLNLPGAVQVNGLPGGAAGLLGDVIDGAAEVVEGE